MNRAGAAASPRCEVQLRPIEDLQPAPYNPRRELQPHDPAFQKLEQSLRQFGLVEPLVWNRRSGCLVSGHARLRILRRMGVTHVPVSIVDLSPSQERALNVVLNNRRAQGEFDPARLAAVLDELADLPEFDWTGFEHQDLRMLHLEPAADLPPPEPPELVTVTLEMTRDQFGTVRPHLDALVRQFELTSHVIETAGPAPSRARPTPRMDQP